MPAGADGVVLHGDYRLDNVIVGADDGVAAVLDWEMSTLGDPLADVALLVAYRDRRTSSGPDRSATRRQARASPRRRTWSPATPSDPAGTSPGSPGTWPSPTSSSR